MNTIAGHRIAGTAALLLVLSLVALGFQVRFTPPTGSTTVFLSAPVAGIGLQPGTDVKVRGVPVGRVTVVDLDDNGRPLVTILLDPGVQVPRDDLEVIITPKTFFGEKQIVLIYDAARHGQPPFLADGDTITTERFVTEVEQVLETLQPLLDDIDEQDIATLFDALAALEGEGDRIAENLEITAELARFGVDITDDLFATARALTSLSRQLEAGAGQFDRLNATLPAAVALLSERQVEIETNLQALSSFALAIASWIDVERSRLDLFISTGDLVGAFLERNIEEIPSLVEGLAIFAEYQSAPSEHVFLDDRTVYVPFKVFFDFRGDGGDFGLFGDLLTSLAGTGGR